MVHLGVERFACRSRSQILLVPSVHFVHGYRNRVHAWSVLEVISALSKRRDVIHKISGRSCISMSKWLCDVFLIENALRLDTVSRFLNLKQSTFSDNYARSVSLRLLKVAIRRPMCKPFAFHAASFSCTS